MAPRTAAYILFPAATLMGVLLAYLAPRERESPPAEAPDDRTANRCAVLDGGAPATDQILHLAPAGDGLVVGVVADARGAEPRTLDRLRAARRAFAEAGADLVLSLGGMGADAGELAAVYRLLADEAPWQVVAIPGDREPVAAHRRVVAELASSQPILDGSAIRIIAAGDATIATFPGVGHRSQLVAGSGGCLYRAGDADALARWLSSREGPIVWAGYAPPRQRGAGASDLVRGVHIGDPRLAPSVRASGAALALHGLVDEAALRAGEGVRRLDADGYLGLAPGPAQALPVLGERRGAASGSALIVRLRPPRAEWERLRLAPESDFGGSAAAPRASE